MKNYMYILQCADGSYYTGSTKNLEARLYQHQNGEGAKHTKSRLPVKLIYFEEFERIDEAFYREKQIQGWSRKKKEALIAGDFDKLSHLSQSKSTQYNFPVAELVEATKSGSEPKAKQAHYEMGAKVRQTIEDLGGTMPEELPTPKTSTKTLEKQHNKRISSGGEDE